MQKRSVVKVDPYNALAKVNVSVKTHLCNHGGGAREGERRGRDPLNPFIDK